MRRRVHPTTLARREREREAEERRERAREESRRFFAAFDRVLIENEDEARRAWSLPTLRTFTTAVLADGTHVSEIVRGVDGEWFVQAPHFPGWRFYRLVPRDHDAHVAARLAWSLENHRCVYSGTPHPWRVARVIDRGPAHYYRFHVEGENLNWPDGHPDRRLSWDVPNLDCAQYDVSGATWERPAS